MPPIGNPQPTGKVMDDVCPCCGSRILSRHYRRPLGSPLMIGGPLPNANCSVWECESSQIDGGDLLQSWRCRATVAEAIIAKLPKTADGVVPWPLMRVWLKGGTQDGLVCMPVHCEDGYESVTVTYSTREASKFAKEQAEKGTE